MGKLRDGWMNAYYRNTAMYIAVMVTLIFCLQIYRYFFALPADQVNRCPTRPSAASLVPVIGVFFDDIQT